MGRVASDMLAALGGAPQAQGALLHTPTPTNEKRGFLGFNSTWRQPFPGALIKTHVSE